MIDLKSAVAECRTQILMDVDKSDYRWSDALMVRSANWTILEMLQRKPILRFTAPNAYKPDEAFLVPEDALKNDGTFEVVIPAKYREAFIHGLAAKCLNSESGNQVEAAKMSFEMQRFTELLQR